MVGKKYENEGIAKHGAKMVMAVANAQVPRFTVTSWTAVSSPIRGIIRRRAGAGGQLPPNGGWRRQVERPKSAERLGRVRGCEPTRDIQRVTSHSSAHERAGLRQRRQRDTFQASPIPIHKKTLRKMLERIAASNANHAFRGGVRPFAKSRPVLPRGRRDHTIASCPLPTAEGRGNLRLQPPTAGPRPHPRRAKQSPRRRGGAAVSPRCTEADLAWRFPQRFAWRVRQDPVRRWRLGS